MYCIEAWKPSSVGIIGLGYVGLPLAVGFAQAGLTVREVEQNADKVTRVNAGDSYIDDVAPARLQAVVSTGAHGMQVVVRDVDGTPLSTDFLMFHGTRIAYGIWGGTSAIGLTKGAAVAMYVFMLQELQANGYEYLDWCDASYPGYSDFKLEFGGTLTICLAISKEPLWLKALTSGRVRLSQLKGALRRH